MRLFIDGNGLACKLWWASPIETGRRFARVVSELRRLFDVESPVAAWDSHARTWRHELMPGYKSNRPPKPEALLDAIEECRALPMQHVEAPGYEADDVLATLARAENALPVVILTEDKDMAQLVAPGVMLCDMTGKLVRAEQVEERWGVPPCLFTHLVSWMGDSADGLPGVRGIGKVKGLEPALAGRIGDPLTFDLAQLATVPASALVKWGHGW